MIDKVKKIQKHELALCSSFSVMYITATANGETGNCSVHITSSTE
jgi:hypothetical protein